MKVGATPVLAVSAVGMAGAQMSMAACWGASPCKVPTQLLCHCHCHRCPQVDVEGFEPSVLQSARDLLLQVWQLCLPCNQPHAHALPACWQTLADADAGAVGMRLSICQLAPACAAAWLLVCSMRWSTYSWSTLQEWQACDRCVGCGTCMWRKACGGAGQRVYVPRTRCRGTDCMLADPLSSGWVQSGATIGSGLRQIQPC